MSRRRQVRGAASLQSKTRQAVCRNTPRYTSNETNLCCVLSVFLLGEVSVRRFDTVTSNKSIYCKQMQKLIGSCYIVSPESLWPTEPNSWRKWSVWSL